MTREIHTQTLLGILIFLTGMSGIGAELWEHRTLHPFNGSVGVGLLVLGSLLINPQAVGSALKQVLDAVKQLLPWKGGNNVGGG